MWIIALIVLEPPSTLPRGAGSTTPSSPACGVVRNAQSTDEPHIARKFTVSSRPCAAPASRSSTPTSGFSDNRAASTHPAVPPPTMMYSYPPTVLELSHFHRHHAMQ